jgi:hypothetical protein
MNRTIEVGARALAGLCLLLALTGCEHFEDAISSTAQPDGMGKGAGTVIKVDPDHNTFDCTCTLLNSLGPTPTPAQGTYTYSTVGTSFHLVASDYQGIGTTSVYTLAVGNRVIVTASHNTPNVATDVVILQ